jgi:hypothetical protein
MNQLGFLSFNITDNDKTGTGTQQKVTAKLFNA